MCFVPRRRALFRHLDIQKWSEVVLYSHFDFGILRILAWQGTSRHNDLHFFDIATSKSGQKLVCFAHFDLDMCFVPQPRAVWRHLNFQTRPDAKFFFAWKPGSRRNGVHFFNISTTKNALEPALFDTFDFQMCFGSQQRGSFHLLSGHLAPHRRCSAYFSTVRATNHRTKAVLGDFGNFFAHLHLRCSNFL